MTTYEKLNCKICYSKWDGFIGLNSHISQKHKFSSKEYYDKFLKKERDGFCICGKSTSYLNLKLGYSKHCSYKCSNSDPEVKARKEQSYLAKYGIEHPWKNREVLKKTRATWFKKYGVEFPSQNPEIGRAHV